MLLPPLADTAAALPGCVLGFWTSRCSSQTPSPCFGLLPSSAICAPASPAPFLLRGLGGGDADARSGVGLQHAALRKNMFFSASVVLLLPVAEGQGFGAHPGWFTRAEGASQRRSSHPKIPILSRVPPGTPFVRAHWSRRQPCRVLRGLNLVVLRRESLSWAAARL